MLSRWHVCVMVLFGALVAMLATVASAEQTRSVTVRELIALNHELQVEAGTEVL
jgi:hypothetical protein